LLFAHHRLPEGVTGIEPAHQVGWLGFHAAELRRYALLQMRRKFERRSTAPFGPGKAEPKVWTPGEGEVLGYTSPSLAGIVTDSDLGHRFRLAEVDGAADLDELTVDADRARRRFT
jgi:hypothetical protein